jgi:hypothetical protein
LIVVFEIIEASPTDPPVSILSAVAFGEIVGIVLRRFYELRHAQLAVVMIPIGAVLSIWAPK